MLAKLALVALLVALHFWMRRIMADLATGRGRWSPGRLRLLNEAPTVLLVLITILAVFKTALPWRGLGLTAALLVVFLWAGIRGYARHRNREGARRPRPGPEET
jgi:putative membrane protein